MRGTAVLSFDANDALTGTALDAVADSVVLNLHDAFSTPVLLSRIGMQGSYSWASGEAVLVSWAMAHSRTGRTAPLALVELAEGPWMYARLDGVAGPREGLPLYASFVHPDDGESYPVFKERRA